MKIVSRNILPFQEAAFFHPIREKINYAWLICHSARSLLLENEEYEEKEKKCAKFRLVVSKMSRLFFCKDEKFFSVSFPFSVITSDNRVIEINTASGIKVDNQIISSVISILNTSEFQLNPSPIYFSIDANGPELAALGLLEEIFKFEPGYIRFDSDQARAKGKLHPENHLDINYSNYSTYKLGLKKPIIEAYFQNILNLTTDCSFLVD